jgi:hypothetical protein
MKNYFYVSIKYLYKKNIVPFRFFKKYNKMLVMLIGVNYGGQYQFATRYLTNSLGLRRGLKN